MDEMLRELERYGRYADGLRLLMQEAQSMMPERAEGRDKRRVALVVLGADGFPGTLRIESDWARKTKPEFLGDAVLNAFQAAVAARMEAWSQELERSGWTARSERLTPEEPGPAPVRGGLPPAFGGTRAAPTAFARPARPIEAIVDDAFRAFDKAEEPPPVPEATGTAASRRVRVTLSGDAGLAECHIDPHWAAGKSSTMLNGALAEALEQARDVLEASGGVPSLTGELNSLFGELMTLLQSPERLGGF